LNEICFGFARRKVQSWPKHKKYYLERSEETSENRYLKIVDRSLDVNIDVQTCVGLAQRSNVTGVVRAHSFIWSGHFTFVETKNSPTNNSNHKNKEKQEFWLAHSEDEDQLIPKF
jgi:hypothetical protein